MRAAADLLDAETRRRSPGLMTPEMGKTLRGGQGRGRQVRQGDAVLRRARRGVPGRRAGRRRRGRRLEGVRPLPAARPGAGGHAVELPALAGDAVRRARADGRQRRPAQARVERAADARSTSRTCSAGPGFPDGAFQTLLIGSGAVERVLRDPRVRAATLTGSEPAGRSVAAIAGGEVKKTVLELGGSDPFIVMPSADIARAAQVAVTARCQNNGQSCIAAKRFIVHTDVYDEFAAAFVGAHGRARRSATRWTRAPTSARSRPSRGATDVEELVDDAVDKGATVLFGGEAPDGPAGSTRRPSSPTSRRTCGCTPRRSSARSPGSTASRRSTRRSRSPTRPTSGSARTRGPPTPASRSAFVAELDAGAVFVNGMVTSYPRAAVRRRQAVRLRPRAVRPRHPRVLQPQDRLGGVTFWARVRGGRDRCSRAQTVGPSRPCPAGSAFTRPTSALRALGASAMIAEKYLQREFWGC